MSEPSTVSEPISAAPPPDSTTVFTELTPKALGMLLVLCGALFLDSLDVSMKSVALPAIGTEFGLSSNALQWIITGYAVGYGGFLLLGGRAADLLGRRRMLLVSLAVFVVASAVGGAATDSVLLFAARIVTGISAAFSTTAGFSIITTSFAEGGPRNKALSIYASTGAVALALGLVVGGLLSQASWRWVFFAPAIFGFVALAVAVWLVPRSTPPARAARSFDVAGAVTITAAMLLLVFTLAEAPNSGWLSGRTLISAGAFILLLSAFVVIEKRTANPLVRLGILRSSALLRVGVGAMSLIGGWIGLLTLITIYLQEFRGWTPLESGLAAAPTGVVGALLSPRVAPLVSRFGTAPVALAGLTLAAVANLLLRFLAADSSYLTVLLPVFVLMGVAFSLAYGPLTMAASDAVPAADQGLAGGLVNTAFLIGPALGLSMATAVNTAYSGPTPALLLEGIRVGLLVPLTISVIGALVMIPALRRR